MEAGLIQEIIARQRQFFTEGLTREISFRLRALQKLGAAVESREEQFLEALKSDLHRAPFETYAGELAIFYEEVHFALKNLEKWVRPRKVRTSLTALPGRSVIYCEPRGVSLIISPWNYPLQLLLVPLVGSIAAGNTAVVKPSEYAPQTDKLLYEILTKTFDANYIACMTGGRKANEILLDQHFDHIFFTGSTTVGRVVMEKAAKYLTPVTLELGGKSPCIVDETAPLEPTARRLTWGKFFNAGQTCVAPDYLLVHKSIKPQLLAQIETDLREFFTQDPSQSPDYAHIVNEKHFLRLSGLLEIKPAEGRIALGGTPKKESLYFPPTVVELSSTHHPLMKEEIFGPILPVLEFQTVDEAMAIIQENPKPLALYLFSKDQGLEDKIVNQVSFGGGCINDTMLHLDNPRLPFGGIGPSGIGAYHGEDSFLAFSHRKSVLKKSFWGDLRLRYPPYQGKLSILKRIKGKPKFSRGL